MMQAIISTALVLGIVTSQILGNPINQEKCVPGVNCNLPACRCWNDSVTPGNFSQDNTPQMIILAFDFSFNSDTLLNYMKLFGGLFNPNKCKVKGTFFVQKYNSDPKSLKNIYDDGHELAVNSVNGIIPTGVSQWDSDIREVKDFIVKAGVPEEALKGDRSPQLYMGGNDELEALVKNNLVYDSSCVNVKHGDSKHLLWPYTFDYVNDLPKCSIGHTVKKSFPGIWEFPIATLNHEGTPCPTPSACIPVVNDTDTVFKFFFNAFSEHYYNNRAPLVLNIDARWLKKDSRMMGTKEFLEVVRAYPDTWILTMSQVLEWIKNPSPMKGKTDFPPWRCN